MFPNILFLMTDQMQAQVLDSGHPCQTPNFDRLAARGTRFPRAYTPNPVCSPARASLMTGLLPHNHGVLDITHGVADDQSCLRTDRGHWAQRLRQAGYRTGYFGKWHVERSGALEEFGWDVNGHTDRGRRPDLSGMRTPTVFETPAGPKLELHGEGYCVTRLYGMLGGSLEDTPTGVVAGMAEAFLDEALKDAVPWCCFVSTPEPHDPFVCLPQSLGQYDSDRIPLAPNGDDPMTDKPALYRRSAKVWAEMTGRQKREARGCYYAAISQIDEIYGRLIRKVEDAGAAERTIIIVTSDHGEFLGAHGLYCKNIGAFEEAYRIPLIVAGPGVEANATPEARVGLHDLAATLPELAGCPPLEKTDGRSFAAALGGERGFDATWEQGFAEYNGVRVNFTQRVVWDGDWKYVFNGFDEDELYNLKDDPGELRNLASDSGCEKRLHRMIGLLWDFLKRSGDASLSGLHYPPLRLLPFGPEGKGN